MEIGEKFACKCVMMQSTEKEKESGEMEGLVPSNNEYLQSNECKMLDPICGQ